MRYIFVVNGSPDKAFVLEEVQRQLAEVNIDHELYVTTGVGDGTRFVRIWCDLHRGVKACFVSCGGSGTANEVASGIMGFHDKYMAYMALCGTNDFCKYYPNVDFTSLKKILEGEPVAIDILRANDSYALNMINVGFTASAAAEGNRYIEEGKSHPYERGIANVLFTARHHHIRIKVDGRQLRTKIVQMCDLANGHFTGGKYNTAPQASNVDGLMDITLMRPMSLTTFFYTLPYYTAGKHFGNKFLRQWIKYEQAKHVEMTSRDLITIALDGEIIASTSIVVDVLPKAIQIIMPKADEPTGNAEDNKEL